MASLTDRLLEDPAPPAVQLQHPLPDLPVLIAAALADLTVLAGEAVAVSTSRHTTGPGFLSPEAEHAQNALVAAEKRAQHQNRELALKLTGPIPAPAAVPAVSIVAEIDQFLFDIVDDLHRRLRRAGVCLMSEPAELRRNQRLTRDRAAGYATALVGVYTRPGELRRIHTDAVDLAARARRYLDGTQTVAHDEPCPWCGRRTLVAHLDTGVIRCESDRDTGTRHPCWCTDRYCPCHATPVGHRHEWHRDVLKPDPAPGEARHRLRSQTWHGLRDLLNARPDFEDRT